MKQIATMLVLVMVLIMVCDVNTMDVTAEEVVIESISETEENLWENRPLIQTTSYENEYLGAVRLGAFTMPVCDAQDIQTIYMEISRCIVRVEMGKYAGNGVIWRMEEEGMVIAANKHLLREAAYGMVTFPDGTLLQAEIMAFSQEYDLGFLLIPRNNLTSEVLRECYEVRTKGRTEGEKVIQIAYSQENVKGCYEGSVVGETFVPEFQTSMLETRCYSKAGMSGGGVFDEEGFLIGMIAGGEAEAGASVRESEITYSIFAEDIEQEYQSIDRLEIAE